MVSVCEVRLHALFETQSHGASVKCGATSAARQVRPPSDERRCKRLMIVKETSSAAALRRATVQALDDRERVRVDLLDVPVGALARLVRVPIDLVMLARVLVPLAFAFLPLCRHALRCNLCLRGLHRFRGTQAPPQW